MADRYEDTRGVIQDLFDGDAVSVTRITTLENAVRGNHFHKLTTQWTLVLSGRLRVRDSSGSRDICDGDMIKHDPGVPHAWRALEDTVCLVFTRGPRSGENYESDTYRLGEALL